mmetsp:Transcript_7899/g.12592  ORF Transcript_7899/g.12592 Transcript_7899/m.12592 type:complete len:153 (+) Transcript_7899:34-492(+)
MAFSTRRSSGGRQLPAKASLAAAAAAILGWSPQSVRGFTAGAVQAVQAPAALSRHAAQGRLAQVARPLRTGNSLAAGPGVVAAALAFSFSAAMVNSSRRSSSVARRFFFGGGDKKEVGGTIYDFSVKDIDGRNVSLKDYEGKVLLVVNVASK